MSDLPRASPERIARALRERGMAFDTRSVNMAFVEIICAEFNHVLDELTADPVDTQLLEAAACRLYERYRDRLAVDIAAAERTVGRFLEAREGSEGL